MFTVLLLMCMTLTLLFTFMENTLGWATATICLTIYLATTQIADAIREKQ